MCHGCALTKVTGVQAAIDSALACLFSTSMDINADWDFPSLLFEVCGELTPHPQYEDGIANGTVTDDWAWGAFRSQLALMGHMHEREEGIVDPISVEEGFYPVLANPDSDRLLEMQFGVAPEAILGRYFPMIGLGAANVLDEIGTYAFEALDLYIPSTGVSGRRSTEGWAIAVTGGEAGLNTMAEAIKRASSPYMAGYGVLQTAGFALLRGDNNIVYEDDEDEDHIPEWPLATRAHIDILPLVTAGFDADQWLDELHTYYWFPVSFEEAERHPSQAVTWLPSVLDWGEPLPADAYRFTFTVPEWSIPVASWTAGMVAVIAGIFGVHGALMRVTRG